MKHFQRGYSETLMKANVHQTLWNMSTRFQNTRNRDSTFCAHLTTICTPLSLLWASVIPCVILIPWYSESSDWEWCRVTRLASFHHSSVPNKSIIPRNESSPLQELISVSHVFCFRKVSWSKQEVSEAAVKRIEVWSILTCFLEIISTEKNFRKKSNLRSALNLLALWRKMLKNISCGLWEHLLHGGEKRNTFNIFVWKHDSKDSQAAGP
jgi:hypothetical protein